MCPEHSSCSPDESLSCPDCSHLVSLSPSTPTLKFFISLCTWMVFPVLYIFQIFHVATLAVVLGVRREVRLAASFRLSLHCIICFQDGDPSLSWRMFWFVVVDAFITSLFTGRVVSSPPTPLSYGRVGPALVVSYKMHGRAVGLFYFEPIGQTCYNGDVSM